jgi:chromosome segregation ATPase
VLQYEERLSRVGFAVTDRHGGSSPEPFAELNLGGVSNSVKVRSAIELSVTELRKWEEWSDKGREQLDAWGNKVKLADIVTEHASLVTELYDWFRKGQSELHQRDLEELAQLQSEREGLQQELNRLDDLLELTEKAAGTMQEERQRLIGELTRARERANRLEADLEKARRPWWRR